MPEPVRVDLHQFQSISLANFDGGTLDEEFKEKMTEIVEVLGDPEHAGPCMITIKFGFKPAKRKGFVESTAQIAATVPARKRANILMLRDGRIVQDVTSSDATQPGLFPRETKLAEGKQ